jgi:hypothetical protein
MADCLTGPNRCWSEFDPNSASACVLEVVGRHGNETVEQIKWASEAIGCSESDTFGLVAVAVELSRESQQILLNCVGKFSSSIACTSSPVVENCLQEASYDVSLCEG